MTTKIEVGKLYRLRNGQKVYILAHKPFYLKGYPYEGKIQNTNGCLYWSEFGIYDADISVHPYDIVEEIKDPFNA